MQVCQLTCILPPKDVKVLLEMCVVLQVNRLNVEFDMI